MKFYWDRKQKRFRNEKGHYARRPTAKDLRRDKRGNFIDDRGKRIPAAFPIFVPVEPKVLVKEESVTEPPPIADKFFSFSHLNKQPSTGERLADGFRGAFDAHARKSGLEADDWTVYRYGLHVRPMLPGEVTDNLIGKLSADLEESELPVTIIRIDEGDGHQSVRFLWGEEPTDPREVARSLKDNDAINGVWDLLEAYFHDYSWSFVWETDEEMYDAK